MNRARTLFAGIGAALLATAIAPIAALAAEAGVADKHPIYVGVRACTACHDGPDAGHQFSLWRTSPHARAYASLWSDDAKKIAQLSGIPDPPQKAPMCLGCHATAADAEAWERDDAFRIEDGVSCERCHGAGSEYMTTDVMMNPKLAMKNGLKMPTGDDCMVCHRVKGSHVAILKSPAFDMKTAMKRIAHPTPDHASTTTRPTEPPATTTQAAPPTTPSPHKYTGATACATCHGGPDMGFQFSRWRLSHHARAYAVLGTPAGRAMAEKEKVAGDPQASPMCLRCHTTGAMYSPDSFLPDFDRGDGVTCEACHGPGADYSPEAIMRDSRAARQAGLLAVTKDTCRACHENAHGRPFDVDAGWKKIAHPKKLPAQAAGPRYRTPLNLAISPNGRELYVACEASDSVIVVDVASRRVVAEIACGGQPHDVTFSPDGARAFVSNRLTDNVSVIDVATRRVIRTIPVGDEPHGVLTDAQGRLLYVLNTSSDNLSVIDLATLTETRRLDASRAPWSLALSPDGTRVVVTNTLSRFVAFRTPSRSELTILDAERGTVIDRRVVAEANLLSGVAWHPSGEFALFTLNRTKNLVPMTQLLQGWTITNGLGIYWRDGRIDQVLLDEPQLCFPDPVDVTFRPDGLYAFVVSGGSDRVAVVDVARLRSMIESASPYEREHILPNHLGKPTEFIVAHIPTKDSPRGIVASADNRWVYVANSLDDSVTVIDAQQFTAVDRIDLGGPTQITKARWGERLFHSAAITFRRQFSCRSCHPDGHVDGLTYDIEADGIGISPVDNRTLRGILDTGPFKWEGTNPTLKRQCGARLAAFFTRIQPFTPDELNALDYYICTIPRPPNRYRPLGAELTPAQRRGKAVFERTRTNDGRVIPELKRCITCHPPPTFTDARRHDVGTKTPLDRESHFDAPHLNNIYDSAPYLHNGMAETLEEIWTRYNPYDMHGATNDMTKDQLNDLIEYLKTL